MAAGASDFSATYQSCYPGQSNSGEHRLPACHFRQLAETFGGAQKTNQTSHSPLLTTLVIITAAAQVSVAASASVHPPVHGVGVGVGPLDFKRPDIDATIDNPIKTRTALIVQGGRREIRIAGVNCRVPGNNV